MTKLNKGVNVIYESGAQNTYHYNSEIELVNDFTRHVQNIDKHPIKNVGVIDLKTGNYDGIIIARKYRSLKPKDKERYMKMCIIHFL